VIDSYAQVLTWLEGVVRVLPHIKRLDDARGREGSARRLLGATSPAPRGGLPYRPCRKRRTARSVSLLSFACNRRETPCVQTSMGLDWKLRESGGGV
jgi:hypothetical protein